MLLELNKVKQLLKHRQCARSLLLVLPADALQQTTSELAASFFGGSDKQHLSVLQHPDLLIIDLGSKSIGVDIARELINYAQQPPYAHEQRLVFLYRAENLTLQASNALLKILEEPNDATIILTCEQPQVLIETLLSRLTIINVILDNVQQITKQVDLQKIAEQLHIAWILNLDNPLNISAQWSNWPKLELITALHSLLIDILTKPEGILLEIRKKIPGPWLYQALDSLEYMNKALLLQQNLNWQLFLDQLILLPLLGENVYART